MKKNAPVITDSYISMLPVNSLHERLIKIYWDKKNLEEFLPQIAGYSSPKELLAITLSQLSIIEKELVWLMQEIAESENGLEKSNLQKE